MTYEHHWTEEFGSEDSHGRALWALGGVVGRSFDAGRQGLSSKLFHAALPVASGFSSPRAWAYALLGIHEYLRAYKGDSNIEAERATLAGRLLDLYRRTETREWPWFEDRLTYCNARLSQALIVSGGCMENEEMKSAGLLSLEWLSSTEFSSEGYFSPVGSNGFYPRGEERAAFDQQPVEACAMISACLESHQLTGDNRWAERARRAFGWFLGQNRLQQPLYDATTGGCRDGLHEDRVNENQGAESTLSFLLALCEMRAAARGDLAELAGRKVRA
jgi:hypothetical protein